MNETISGYCCGITNILLFIVSVVSLIFIDNADNLTSAGFINMRIWLIVFGVVWCSIGLILLIEQKKYISTTPLIIIDMIVSSLNMSAIIYHSKN